ncbi:MAG: HNH endonuclease [Rhodocyclaceae bacterium]|nr:HNH endonuclease [Rhodocyclaceae bacterium]MCP5234787.1 HNH endonuclease [Zoogloeaceae bacterium]
MSNPYGQRWRKARREHLRAHPLCIFCQQQGHTTPATVVDHITPHRGDMKLFWNRRNWQSLCETCHNAAKQALERSGHFRGSDLAGQPLDPGHHWNAA